MGVAGKITVDLEARDARWSDTINKSERTLKSFVNNTETAVKNLSGKNGAGAFAGQFASDAKAFGDIVTAIRTGESALKIFGDLVNQIPIVGQFKQAGEAIREMITGENAAREEVKKLNESLDHTNAIYREIAVSKSMLGKYGDERKRMEAEAAAERDVARMRDERLEKKKEIAKIREENPDMRYGFGAGKSVSTMSAEQKERVATLEKEIKALEERERFRSGPKLAQDLADQKRDITQRELEWERSQFESTEDFKVAAQEKSLRRQGRGIESAQLAIKARAEAQQRQRHYELDDFKLAGMDPKRIEARRKLVDEQDKAAEKALGETLADLKYEEGRKLSEQEKENEQELLKIKAEANIEKLKQSNNQLAAQQAQVRLNYATEVAQLEKKYREENRATEANLNDPILKQQLVAAEMRRDNALETAAFNDRKSKIDEERKLWEEVGSPVQQYAAKLEAIGEQYDKLHDKQLALAEVRHLDVETVGKLRKMEAPKPHLELYGRRLDFRMPATRGGSTAESSLSAIKQQVGFLASLNMIVGRLYQIIQRTDSRARAGNDLINFTGMPN